MKGTTICPGIGISRVRVLDRGFVIPRNKIPAAQVQSEQQRYSQAIRTVSDNLHEYIEEDHSDFSLSASLILKNHEAMLVDEKFHNAVCIRISTEHVNARWAIESEAEEIIAQLEASRSPYLQSRATGQYPALGVRGVRRHLLRRPEELQTQLRAILHAAVGCQVGILLLMVTTVDDIREIKRVLKSVKEELLAEGRPIPINLKFGAMIEVPAAAIGVDGILKEVDFISIGTNDLLQYFLAADRDNEAVLRYEELENEAFLWLLHYIIERAVGLAKEKDVTIRGESASNPHLVSLLLGLGFRSLSITPTSARSVRSAVAGVDLRTSAGKLNAWVFVACGSGD